MCYVTYVDNFDCFLGLKWLSLRMNSLPLFVILSNNIVFRTLLSSPLFPSRDQ